MLTSNDISVKDAVKGTSAGAAIAEMVVLLVVWGTAIALVYPRGNFPSQDDWHHAWATLQFARTGEFHMTRYTAPSLRVQVVWGALWIRAFGFSFEVLRASTLTLSAGALLLINRLLAALSLPVTTRWIATLAFLFHPVFLFSSCTFMTEVPFVFVSVVAYAFIAAGFERDRTSLVAIGTAAAVVSCFIRQSGAINIAAAGLLLLLFRERIARRWIAHGLALASGVLALAIIAVTHREWLAGSLREFSTHYDMWSQSTFGVLEQIATAAHYTWFQACYSALFFLPLAAPLVLLLRRGFLRRGDVMFLSVIALALLVRSISLISQNLALPFTNVAYKSDVNLGHTLNDIGIGPLTLHTISDVNPNTIHLLRGAKGALTIFASLLGAVAIWAFIKWLLGAALRPADNVRALVAASFAICGSLGLIISAYYFDRYSFDSAWAFVLVLPLMVPWEQRAARAIGAAALVVVAIFSVTAVHDYFAWNRARWTAYEHLRARGVAKNQIDGGLEVLGWEELVRNPSGPKWLAMENRRYIILFRPPPMGTTVVETVPYRRWLGLWDDRMYVVRRDVK